jgi:hypothetical protein
MHCKISLIKDLNKIWYPFNMHHAKISSLNKINNYHDKYKLNKNNFLEV